MMQKSILKQLPFKDSLFVWLESKCQMSRRDWCTKRVAVIQHHLGLITLFYPVHFLEFEVSLFALGFSE